MFFKQYTNFETPIQKTQPNPYNINIMSEEQKPDIKPAATDADHVSIKVTDGDSDIHFKIKKGATLKKLMDAWAKRQGKDVSALVFTFEGITLTPEHTPEDLAMENNDIIEVYRHQSGGYAC